MTKFGIVAAAVVAIATSGSAQAAQVEYTFNGTLKNTYQSGYFGAGTLINGASFILKYIVDTDTSSGAQRFSASNYDQISGSFAGNPLSSTLSVLGSDFSDNKMSSGYAERVSAANNGSKSQILDISESGSDYIRATLTSTVNTFFSSPTLETGFTYNVQPGDSAAGSFQYSSLLDSGPRIVRRTVGNFVDHGGPDSHIRA